MPVKSRQADYHEPLVFIVLVPFLQTRKSNTARAAPGCPEVQQHHASAQIGEFYRLLIDPLIARNFRGSGLGYACFAERLEGINRRIYLDQTAERQLVQIPGRKAQR